VTERAVGERLTPPETAVDAGKAPSRGWEAVAVATILLFAAVVRLASIDTLPPGLHQDEAVYLVDSESILYGPPQIYYGEREPLYMYVVAGASLVLGASPLTLRITAALFSLAEVAAGGALARQLFGRKVGLIAAAGLASSLWLTALGRTGFRAISLPAVECLGLAVLWHATRSGSKREYAAAGGILGLALYTYLSSRFLPVALLVFVATAASVDRPWLAKRLPGLLLAGLTAFLVCVPLGLYGYRHPEIFFGRPDQVALPGGASFLPALVDSSLRTLGMITFRGDPTWRHNLSGAPVLDPLNAVLFVVGLGVALARRGPTRLYLLIVLVVMVVPGMLSIDSPHFLRTDGAVGPIYAVWAIGVAWTSKWLSGVIRLPVAWRYVTALAIALPLTVAATRDAWGYFVTYAHDPEMPAAYNVELAAAGQAIARSALWRSSRSDVYVSDSFKQDRASVAAFVYPLLSTSERARWLDEDIVGTFFAQRDLIPIPVRPSLYVVSDDRSVVEDALGTMVRRQTQVDVGGGKSINLIEAAPSVSSSVWSPLSGGPIQFGQLLTLEGAADESLGASSSAMPTIVLRWRVIGRPSYRPSIYVHVDDTAHRTLAQSDLEITLPSSAWRSGQEWVTYHRPRLPAGTAPGDYEIAVGVYDKSSGAREKATANSKPIVTSLVANLHVDQPVGGVAEVGRRFDQNVAPGLTLLGADPLPMHVEAGSTLPITVVWRAAADALVDYDTTMSIRAPGGALVGEWRGRVGGSAYSTSHWSKGAYIRQTIDVPVLGTASGGVTVSAEVRPTDAAAPIAPDHPSVELGRLIVDASRHEFNPPKPSSKLDVTFGSVSHLIGCDGPAEPVRAGETVNLKLDWQAIQPSDAAYTVFVHLLDDQDHIVGQRDEGPVHGTRPTTGWVAGEYVTDPHAFTVDPSTPSGSYRIEVGLYDPVTGARVQTSAGADHTIIGWLQIQAK
jgi:4-amino-4-deoxy-L-arabinose transferase-like glycosyltransferase